MSQPKECSSPTPSLREEMDDVLRDFESGIESAMEHSCQCGTWEGELSCRHCSLWESARSKAKKRIADLAPLSEIAPSTQPGEPQAPTTAGSSPAALSATNALGWIRDDELKPELWQEVLIYHVLGDRDHPSASHGFDVAWWTDKGWLFPWDRGDRQRPMFVTHWQALPEAP